MLYNTLVLPYFIYCSEVWGRAYRNNLYPLIVKQKHIARIIAKIGRYDHTSPFFSNFKILKLFDLLDMEILSFDMFLAYKESLPLTLQNLFIKYSTIHVTRNPLFFKKKKVNSNLKKMCISVYGVELFQKMYDAIKLFDTLEILKRQIKVIFMCKY